MFRTNSINNLSCMATGGTKRCQIELIHLPWSPYFQKFAPILIIQRHQGHSDAVVIAAQGVIPVGDPSTGASMGCLA
jgi:hypothetical protein